MGNENELGEDRGNEGEEGEGTLLCGSWGQEVGVSGSIVKYLGVMISGNERMEEEIRSMIGKAARVIEVLNEPVWKRKE